MKTKSLSQSWQSMKKQSLSFYIYRKSIKYSNNPLFSRGACNTCASMDVVTMYEIAQGGYPKNPTDLNSTMYKSRTSSCFCALFSITHQRAHAKHPHPRNLALRTVVIISSRAGSNNLTTRIKLG
jgi:hypothetical protein